MNGLRILLVDDNEELLFAFCRLFRNAGFEVSAAPDAESAIANLREIRPDIVLSDLRLPGRSGLDVLRAVREAYPDVPVLLVTAYGDDATRDAARDLGAYAMLIKPVMRRDLLGAVNAALTLRAA